MQILRASTGEFQSRLRTVVEGLEVRLGESEAGLGASPVELTESSSIVINLGRDVNSLMKAPTDANHELRLRFTRMALRLANLEALTIGYHSEVPERLPLSTRGSREK